MNFKVEIKGYEKVEVTNISSHGIWVYLKDEEHFLSYEKFPWFKQAKITQILNVELIQEGHLYLPDLDVDLSIDSINNPKEYPLIAKKQLMISNKTGITR